MKWDGRTNANSQEACGVSYLQVDLDVLSPAERRDLANARLRAAWSATLEETRVLLLDLLVKADDGLLGEAV
jgi:hypothetical protein